MGTKLVRRKGLITLAAAAVVCAACNQPAAPPLSQAVPKIRATVVTVETKLQPSNKTLTHTIIVSDGRARSSDDVDHWRLFDLKSNRVTFVDDVAKTSTEEPLDTLLAARRRELAAALPVPMPSAGYALTGAKRTLLGVEAAEHVVRLGGYQRHLWIAKHPAVPPGLFAMMEASRPRSSALAGVARAADEALMTVQGFPLLDQAELAYGNNKKLAVERRVVSIEVRDVPASWLSLPAQSSSRREATGSAVTPALK
jgi:hypothetical protein